MYIVYDINTEKKSNVPNRIFKICKKFLVHIQNSVFERELRESQFLNLKYELRKYLRDDRDSCIIFSSRNEKWLNKDFDGAQGRHVTFLLICRSCLA